MKRQLLIILFSVSLMGTVAHAATDVRFQHFGIAEGLSQPSILCAWQDPNGFMWFCTQQGLNRFDGYQFRIYSIANSKGLEDHYIMSLAGDPDGRTLWLGTRYAGLIRFNTMSDEFEQIPLGEGVQDVGINALVIDSKHRLWIGSKDRGVWLLDLNDENAMAVRVGNPGEMQRFYIDQRQQVWVLTSNSGLWRANATADQVTLTQVLATPTDVHAVTEVWDGSVLWVGSDDGIGCVDLGTGLPGNCQAADVPDVFDFEFDSKEQLWIGSSRGLYRMKGPGQALEHFVSRPDDPNSLSQNFISTIYEDDQGNVWVGTWLAGINMLPAQAAPFRVLGNEDEPSYAGNNSVASMVEDHQGGIWSAFYRSIGVARWNEQQGIFETVQVDADLQSDGTAELGRVLALDRNTGLIWSVANDGTLATIDPEERLYQTTARQPLSGSVIDYLGIDGGRMIVATRNKGLAILDVETLDIQWILRSEDGFLTDSATEAMLDGDLIWVGTDRGLALYSIDEDQVLLVLDRQSEKPLTHSSISTLELQSDQDVLWVGTQGGGLNKVTLSPDHRTVLAVETVGGLQSDSIGGILEDADGNFWVSTAVGISRVGVDGTVRNFGVAEGVQEDGFFIGSYFKARSGRLYFGGRGLLVVEPDEYELPTSIPSVAITEVLVLNRRAQVGGEEPRLLAAPPYSERLTIYPEDYLLTIRFSSPRYDQIRNIRYAYRMVGLDQDWIDVPAGASSATYTHVTPGKYTFEVKAGFDGIEWSDVTALSVHAPPPVWRSAWAVVAYIALLAILIWLPLRSRLARLAEQQRQQTALEESAERLRLALWGSGDELWYYDPMANTVSLTYYDRDRGAFIDSEPEDLDELANKMHVDDRKSSLEQLQRHARGETDALEVMYRRLIGDQWQWFQARGVVVRRDPDQRATLIAGTRRNVNQRMQALLALEDLNQRLEEKVQERTRELASARDLLVEREKMAALGNLVSGVAHELNTPLGITLTAASHLQQKSDAVYERLRNDPDLARFAGVLEEGLKIVIGSMQRASDLVKSFKRVAVDQSHERRKTFDLADYMNDVLLSLQPVYKSRIKLEMEMNGTATIQTDPAAVYQLIQNLVVNSATHAFVGVEKPSIHIKMDVGADRILLNYTDNGCGISDEVRAHIFEPFVTTARKSGSSGLGMHIVYNLVTQVFNGTIRCVATGGQGAHFVVSIPMAGLRVQDPVES
ncbi:MAG: hypothetical protein DHS20C11_12380 [Lysobacteraceae bacterium]|nr:MAG: hypothetical protein DHS20C11_12380 [Xanthomonadaceae bacterium]